MIINTGNRTDIPAFYASWFYHRIEAGYVLSRSPYDPHKIYRYDLHPEVVDLLCFCTKNPHPMFQQFEKLSSYRMYWMVTLTPYGKEIEPNIQNKRWVLQSMRELSDRIGSEHMAWRYDPILLNETYTVESHIRAFAQLCKALSGYTHHVIISFIDLYAKTKRNFPNIQEVSLDDQKRISQAFVSIASSYDMKVYACMEKGLSKYGIDTSGCMSQAVLEDAFHIGLKPPTTYARKGCRCLLQNDIGAYNTCGHGCLYCYANENQTLVKQNQALHDSNSPLLIGHVQSDDTIIEVEPHSIISNQLRSF